MAVPEEIRRLIHAMERNSVTQGEFLDKIWTRLSHLSSAERKVVLEELLAHPDEDVRNAAKECRSLMHYGELSKSLEYIQQNSPLRPGVSMELFGGYDYYSSGGNPLWLDGRDCYHATFLRFASSGENTIPMALVKFDEFVELPRHKGSFAILGMT